MKPTPAQFRKLLSDIYRTIPDDEPTKRERQILISCVLAAAETSDRVERSLKEVIIPALQTLLNGAQSTPATETEATEASATEETEDMPPIARATVTAASPAAPSAAVTVTSAPIPSANGAAATGGASS